MINEPFGWALISAGFLSGAVMGTGFLRDDWLGGYAHPRRRLLRLGHISLVGLGLLNVLFALSARRFAPEAGWTQLGSWCFVIGGATMPLCCGLTAWRPALKPAFAVPVASLLLGGAVAVAGLAGR